MIVSMSPLLTALRILMLAGACLALPATAVAGPVSWTIDHRAASGTLSVSLTAPAGGRTAAVRISGKLRVPHTLQLTMTRCLDTSCRRRVSAGRITASVHPGRRTLALARTIPVSNAVVLRLIAGRTVLSERRVRPVRGTATPPPPPPLDTPSDPPSDIPPPDEPAAPTTLTLATVPALAQEYAPGQPDYTVACPDGAVQIRGAAPAGDTITVDDGVAHSATTFTQSVALTPGQGFTVRIHDEHGDHAHTIRCTPDDLPTWTTERNGTPTARWLVFNPSLNFQAKPYSVIADDHGVPVWWWRSDDGGAPLDAQVLPDHTVSWGVQFQHAPHRHVTLDGQDLGDIDTVGGSSDGHELRQLANGNFLLVAYRPHPHVDISVLGGPADVTILDAVIQEVTPAGAVAWEWSSADHIAVDETAPWAGVALTTFDGQPAYDIVHLNSLDDDGDGIVFSARNLDAVYRIRKSDGAVDWKLGGTVRPESLAFSGDPVAGLGGQHDARILPDGTLTVHDNGTGHDRAPRAVRYVLDTTARTATLLEQLTDPRAPVSTCCGSARRLSDGHWVMNWGFNRAITELAADGSPVLTLTFTGSVFSYRTQPLEAGMLTREELHQGMDARFPR